MPLRSIYTLILPELSIQVIDDTIPVKAPSK